MRRGTEIRGLGPETPVKPNPRIGPVAIPLVAVLILSGCQHGEPSRQDLSQIRQDLSQIRKVGLYVKVERGFAVRLQYGGNADEDFLWTLINYGLLGVAVREFNPDTRATRAMKREAARLKSVDAIGDVLMKKLRAAAVFPAVELATSDSLAATGKGQIDTLFVFTVRRWGLRSPLGGRRPAGDKAPAQLELDMNLRLVSSTTGKTLWKRDEFYLDTESHTLGDFISQTGLLARRMEQALQRACDWTAQEVHRTCYDQR